MSPTGNENLFSFPLPQLLGERVKVRGYLPEKFLYHPSLPFFPRRDLAKRPPSTVILISILKSGSGIPSSPIYAKRPALLY